MSRSDDATLAGHPMHARVSLTRGVHDAVLGVYQLLVSVTHGCFNRKSAGGPKRTHRVLQGQKVAML